MVDLLISILIVLLVVVLFAAALLIFRAMIYGRAPEVVEPQEVQPVDGARVAEHLATAIRVPTVSLGDRSQIDYQSFAELHAALEKMYPRLHATLSRERINEHSLLFTWPGRKGDLEPLLLCAHLDVVPADPATLDEWTHPPFAGVVADGYVWGRGALDMKSTAIAIMETVETLIKDGYQPDRTVYLAFGHDEEIGGFAGARCIAETLARRGERLFAVFDEGGALTTGTLPVALPVATIGIAEKGFASLEMKVEGRPGHSSTPPRHTAIGVLARALARVEASPMPARMSMARLLFEEIGIFLPFPVRLGLSNAWLLGKAVQKRLEKNPNGNALVRTTTAITIVQGGVKDNILPSAARAVVNCRLLPGDTREKVLEHFRRVVDDEAVQITINPDASWEASPVSPVDSPVYQSLARTIRQVFPEAIPAPYLVSGATDSRHYCNLTGSVYRFTPYLMTPDLHKTVHGIDERIPVEALERMVQFYHQLIKNLTAVE